MGVSVMGVSAVGVSAVGVSAVGVYQQYMHFGKLLYIQCINIRERLDQM